MGIEGLGHNRLLGLQPARYLRGDELEEKLIIIVPLLNSTSIPQQKEQQQSKDGAEQQKMLYIHINLVSTHTEQRGTLLAVVVFKHNERHAVERMEGRTGHYDFTRLRQMFMYYNSLTTFLTSKQPRERERTL